MNDTYPEEMPGLIGAENEEIIRISMKDISGRNMYCTDEAFEEIRGRLSEIPSPESGIHFIDTGNYHYMSRIYTSFINVKYDLILFDNHTDMQQAGFGDILSCGSWAREALDKDENLSSLFVYGPSAFEEGGAEYTLSAGGKEITGMTYRGKGYEEGSHPIYLSVDKDILDESYCVTNWDQGSLSLNELCGLIETAVAERSIIGADICGGISESDPGCTGDVLRENTSSDSKLYKTISKLIEGK